MSSPFIGEIRLVPYTFAPNGWAFCQGQLVSIAENTTLFTLIGTIYGGDGQQTFALPNLQSRIVCGIGNGYVQGQNFGVESVTLTTPQIPAHSHGLATAAVASSFSPASNLPAPGARSSYADSTNVMMAADSIASSGGNQPHDNLQPYLVLNYIISLFGIYPSQN